MAGKSFGEEFRDELTGKAVMWGPAIAGAILLGPVGIALGLAASAAVIASGGDNPPQSSDDDPPKD
jgi:uncharacterized membrane protein